MVTSTLSIVPTLRRVALVAAVLALASAGPLYSLHLAVDHAGDCPDISHDCALCMQWAGGGEIVEVCDLAPVDVVACLAAEASTTLRTTTPPIPHGRGPPCTIADS